MINADGSDDGAGKKTSSFEFRPVGYGCQDVAGLILAGLYAKAEAFVVEQDQWYDRHPLEAARLSVEYIKGLNII